MVFYDNEQGNLPNHKNRPFYVREIGLKRGMLDQGSSLNIISLSVLEELDVSRDSLQRQPIEVSGFGGNFTQTFGFVNLDSTIGLIKAARTAYHLLVGLPWIHPNKLVSSTYHQCLKAI